MSRLATTPQTPRVSRTRLRRGLAPLEFIMWIPVLLFVAALMLNYGTAVVWRVRGEIAARDITWRARWSRAPDFEEVLMHDAAWQAQWARDRVIEAPLRPIWPVDATLAVVDDRAIAQLDSPAINHPVIRGPLPNGFIVRDLFNPTKGVLQGNASVVRSFPLLPRLGNYRTGMIRDTLLDQPWPCAETGSVNLARRIPVLYQLPQTEQSLPAAFVSADLAVVMIPHGNALDVLDQDEEVFKYTGDYANFIPYINQGCEIDPANIQRTEINRLVIHTNPRGMRELGEVLLIPRTMTAFYLQMYRNEVARLRAEIQALQQELRDLPAQIAAAPISQRPALQQRQREIPGLIEAAQNAIPPLEEKIGQLEQFQRRITPWEREVLTR